MTPIVKNYFVVVIIKRVQRITSLIKITSAENRQGTAVVNCYCLTIATIRRSDVSERRPVDGGGRLVQRQLRTSGSS